MKDFCKLISYCPINGTFTWKKNGRKAGGIDKQSGYYQIIQTIPKKVKRYGHRLAYACMGFEVPKEIDHKDRDRSNNKWDNLRPVSRRENSRNHPMNKNNTSGHVGVVFMKQRGKWKAQIMVDYKNLHLGDFDLKEDAIAARKAKQEELGFHKNHGKKVV